MSRPGRTLPSDARASESKPKPEKAESKEEVSSGDSTGGPPLRHLAVGSGAAPRGASLHGARIISGIRGRASASGSEAEVEVGPAPAPEAPAVTDLATFEEAVGGLVDATVAKAGTSRSKPIQAMATRLDKAVGALRADLPTVPSELERAVADLLRYRDTVQREADEVVRLQEADLATTVRFGTELTFSHPSLHALLVDPEEKCDKKQLKAAQDAADKYLQDWTKLVLREFSNNKSFTLAVTAADPLSRPDARRFTFTGQTWDDEGNEIPLVWWYQTNVDNSCLELQMAPTTLGEFNDGLISRWAQSIFDVAQQLKLLSGAKSMGGGHLSMDRASTFGDSAVVFTRMVQVYNTRARKGGIHQGYRDDDAPFIHEMEYAKGGKLAGEYEALMHRVEEATLDPSASLSVKDVRDKLWALLTRAKPYRPKLNNHARYTALNIEPVTDAEPAKQRVEFRRFQGQTGMDELCSQLAELLDLVDEARKV
jgi:hypothetical protein